MTTNNTTLTDEPAANINTSVLEAVGLPIDFFLIGLCFENCLMALLDLIPRWYRMYWAAKKEPAYMLTLLTVFNLSGIVYLSSSCVAWFAISEVACLPLNFANNLFCHIFYITFDVYILWKSAVVTDNHRLYIYSAAAALLYRTVWTFIDLAWTGGRWDVESLSCEYHQNPLSAFQYTLGDISCDTVATLGALTAFLRPENRVLSWGSLWFQLLKENVFRSVFTLFVNSISMYVDHVGVDPYVLWIVYSIQDYTYARLMNYELTYKQKRQDRTAAGLVHSFVPESINDNKSRRESLSNK